MSLEFFIRGEFRSTHVENSNYKGLRELGWVSLGVTLKSRAEYVLQSVALPESFPFGIAL